MIFSLTDLTDRTQALPRALLSKALERVRASADDVDAWIKGLLDKDEAFRFHPAAHIEKVRADKTREVRSRRAAATGVLLYKMTKAVETLAPDVRAFRQHVMQAPDAVTAFLARTGGERKFLTDQTELLIQIVDEQRRARFRAELQHAQPSMVHARYQSAVDDDSDDAASLVRFVEDEYGHGWRGATPATDEEIQFAQQLGKAIADTRTRRIPEELFEIEAALEEARAVIARTQAGDLYAIRPANPDHEPAAKAALDAELSELEAVEA